MFVLFLILKSLIIVCSPSVLIHYEETNPDFSMVVYDRKNSLIIVAGVNRLYVFDSLLQLLQSVQTGPLVDRCEGVEDGREEYYYESDYHNTSEEKNMCGLRNNSPRVLKILPHHQQLFFCGSIKNGLCSLYLLKDMKHHEYLKDGNVLNRLGDSSNVVVALSNDQPNDQSNDHLNDQSNDYSNSFFIGRKNSGRDRMPAVAHVVMEEASGVVDLKFKHDEASFKSYLHFSPRFQSHINEGIIQII